MWNLLYLQFTLWCSANMSVYVICRLSIVQYLFASPFMWINKYLLGFLLYVKIIIIPLNIFWQTVSNICHKLYFKHYFLLNCFITMRKKSISILKLKKLDVHGKNAMINWNQCKLTSKSSCNHFYKFTYYKNINTHGNKFHVLILFAV